MSVLAIPLVACAWADQVILPKAVTSATDATDTFKAGELISGAGMSNALATLDDLDTATTNLAQFGNAWVTLDGFVSGTPDYFGSGKPVPQLVFELDGVFRLSEFVFWGYNFNGPGSAAGNEGKTFELTFSVDNVFTAEDPTVTITRTAPTNLNSARNPIFGSPIARFVRVRIPQNFANSPGVSGGDRVGLGEVRFVGGPATSATLGWSSVPSQRNGSFRSSAIAPDGKLTASFVNNGVEYGVFDGTSWTYQTVVNAAGAFYQDTSLAYDNAGRPAITFREFDSRVFSHAVRNNGVWTVTTIEGATNNPGFDSSLGYSPANEAWVSHFAATPGDLRFGRLVAGTWQTGMVDGAAARVGTGSSLAFAPDGQPAISYLDHTNKTVKYAKYNGSTWEIATVAVTGIGDGGKTELKFTPAGKPAIAYYTETPTTFNGNTFNKFRMKYAEFGDSWVIADVNGDADSGSVFSLTFSGGNPVIAFKDVSKVLLFAERVGGVWNVSQAVGSDTGDEINLVAKTDGTLMAVFGPQGINVAIRGHIVSKIQITAVEKKGEYLEVAFKSTANLGKWKAAGRPDFVTAAIDLTGASVVTESTPGVYLMRIRLSSPPARYFVTLASGI